MNEKAGDSLFFYSFWIHSARGRPFSIQKWMKRVVAPAALRSPAAAARLRRLWASRLALGVGASMRKYNGIHKRRAQRLQNCRKTKRHTPFPSFLNGKQRGWHNGLWLNKINYLFYIESPPIVSPPLFPIQKWTKRGVTFCFYLFLNTCGARAPVFN